MIRDWVDQHQPEKQKTKQWAKIYSIVPEHRRRYESRLDEEAFREQFRRAPPLGAVFSAIVGLPDFYLHVAVHANAKTQALFDWPIDHDHPSQIAGKNLEAYDPIRTELSCFIVLDSHQRAIRIMGDNFQNVKKALKRVRISLFQTVARKRPQRVLYLIHPLTGDGLRTDVKLSPYTTSKDLMSKRSGPPKMIPKMSGPLIIGHERSRRENSVDEKYESNLRAFESAISTVLATLRHYRGSIRMRAVLGVFVLSSYKKRDSQSVDDFEEMMEDHQVKGSTVDDNSLDQSILKYTATANSFLSPIDTFDNLMSVRPAFDATFICAYGSAVYRLDASYTQQANGEIACTLKTWTKLNHIEADPQDGLSEWTKEPENKLLDINIVNLDQAYAWNFRTSVSEPVNDAKMLILGTFASGIALKVPTSDKAYQEVDGRYVSFKPVPGLVLQAMQQKQSWTYSIKNSPYLCEVAKIEEFRIPDRKSSKPNQSLLNSTTPQWVVSVFRREWDVLFANNGSLATGESVKWDLSVEKLFPGGIAQFLEELSQTRQVARGEWKGDDLLESFTGSSPSVRFASGSSGPHS